MTPYRCKCGHASDMHRLEPEHSVQSVRECQAEDCNCTEYEVDIGEWDHWPTRAEILINPAFPETL